MWWQYVDTNAKNYGQAPGFQAGVIALRPADPLEGMVYFATDVQTISRYQSGAWVDYGSGGGGGAVTSVNGLTGDVVLTTSNISEGSNLYFTNARARAALSAGTGIGYNSSTGEITNAGVTSFNGSTGAITYSAPVTSVNTQTGAVVLTTSNISEGSNLYFTNARARAALSAGTGIGYNSSTGEITNAGVTSFNGSTGAITFNAAVTSVNGQTGAVVLTTTNIGEGTNLYFTDGRARAALSAGTGIGYNSSTGEITNAGVTSFNGSTGAITYSAPVTSVNGQTGAVVLTTTNIAEGTNLYYTDARARAALSGGTGVTYNSATGVIEIGQSVATSATPVFAGGNFLGNVQVKAAEPYYLVKGTTNNSFRGLKIYGQSDGETEFAFIMANFTTGEFRHSIGFNSYGGYHSWFTNGQEAARITASNELLINTTTADGTNKLIVNGGAKFGTGGTATITNMGAGTFSSTVQATQFNAVQSAGSSLAGTMTGTGANIGSQFKFVNDYNTTGAFIGIAAGETTGDAVFAVGASKKLVFAAGSTGTERIGEFTANSLRIFSVAGNTSNYVQLGAEASITATWLFGTRVSGASVSLDTTQYLFATVNGVQVKIATVI